MRTRVWILRTHVRIIQGGCYHNASTWEAGTGSLGQGGQLTRRTWQALGSVRDPDSASIKKVEMKEDSQHQLLASSWVYTCVPIYTIYMQKLKLVLKKRHKIYHQQKVRWPVRRNCLRWGRGTGTEAVQAKQSSQKVEEGQEQRPGLSREDGPDDESREKMLMNFFKRQSRRENPEQWIKRILCVTPHG